MTKENSAIDSEIMRPTSIISSILAPVYTSSISINDPNYPQAITSLGTAFAQIGQYFTINTGAALAVANDYFYCQFAIPPHWTKEMNVDRIQAGTSSTSVPATIELRSLGTTSLGITLTPVSPINTNLASANTSLVTAGYALSSTNITSGTLLFSYLQVSGTANIDLDGRVIVANPKASSLYFYLKLAANVNANCILGCSWWESKV